MISYPFKTRALRVEQPLGTFFVTVLPAELLLQVAASDILRASRNEAEEGYTVSGTQRAQKEKRWREIADYINRVDSAFPNSVILAANFERDESLDMDETSAIAEESGQDAAKSIASQWSVESDSCGWQLVIPTAGAVASIVDGQHRVAAFRIAAASRQNMQLVCAVFIDLPKSLQAQLFATINSTQKPVDRSVTYEMFGYNVADQPESYWTPDKLAIFLTRKLGTDDNSVLKGRISVAPKKDPALEDLTKSGKWHVSTAVVVDGILRLISSNPQRDSNLMRRRPDQTREVLREGPKDKAPMREIFVEGNDTLIYTTVFNFLTACEDVFWKDAKGGSYIIKTVGVQALFDILRKIAPAALEKKRISVDFFTKSLDAARTIDFSADEYKNASGSGRSYIRKAIEEAINLQP